MLEGYETVTKHVPAAQVHAEYFTAKEEAANEGGYVVELRKSGLEFAIPQGRTILQVLRDAGVDTPYSCESGVCGA